jgi:hypothetical protein
MSVLDQMEARVHTHKEYSMAPINRIDLLNLIALARAAERLLAHNGQSTKDEDALAAYNIARKSLGLGK